MPAPLAILSLLLSAAPTLAHLITGSPRARERVEQAAKVFSEVIGVDAASDEAAAKAALADPTVMAEVRARLAAIEIEEIQAERADRESARARDVEVRRLEGGNRRADAMLYMVFGLLVALLGAQVVIGVFVDGESPHLTAAVGLLGTVVGFLIRALSTAFDFEFGSSRGSASKQQDLMRMAGERQG